MSAFISPYALLTASKPKSAAASVSRYDLYSMAQEQFTDTSDTIQTAAEFPPMPVIPPVQQQKRTHYISDINARHSSAAGRSAFNSSTIP